MKIFIPFIGNGLGGTRTFFHALVSSLSRNGIQVTRTLVSDYDALFIIADCPLRFVLHAKLYAKPIIQRLDGVYHPAAGYTWSYSFRNFKMRLIHNYFADHVIYQSKFSRELCQRFLGIRKGSHTLIYNGVKPSAPRAREVNPRSPKLITAAVFRREDQILPILNSINLLPEDFTLDVYGPIADKLNNLLTEVKKNPRISFKGPVEHQVLMDLFNVYDLFLFSDQSACPNIVLEALSCGLPVIAFNRGGVGELVDDSKTGNVIALSSVESYYQKYKFSSDDYSRFASVIIHALPNLDKFRLNTVKSIRNKFSLESMERHYLAVILRSVEGGQRRHR